MSSILIIILLFRHACYFAQETADDTAFKQLMKRCKTSLKKVKTGRKVIANLAEMHAKQQAYPEKKNAPLQKQKTGQRRLLPPVLYYDKYAK